MSTPLREEVPLQKKRRVLPEHEGRYKIKMPEGTSPKTAKLIAEGKVAILSLLSWTRPKFWTTFSPVWMLSNFGPSSCCWNDKCWNADKR